MSRNAIFTALLALGGGVTAGVLGPLAETGRRLKVWDQAAMPSLFQVEPNTDTASKLGTLPRRTLKVTWVIYHNAGKDQGSVPAAVTSDLLDSIEAAFPTIAGSYQTLGGLVAAAYIDGTIHAFEGDLDGQTVVTVPISILVP